MNAPLAKLRALFRRRHLEAALHEPLQRPGTEHGVVALLRCLFLRLLVELHRHAPVSETPISRRFRDSENEHRDFGRLQQRRSGAAVNEPPHFRIAEGAHHEEIHVLVFQHGGYHAFRIARQPLRIREPAGFEQMITGGIELLLEDLFFRPTPKR